MTQDEAKRDIVRNGGDPGCTTCRGTGMMMRDRAVLFCWTCVERRINPPTENTR